MKRLSGYGLIIKCSQQVPYDEDPAYFEGCFHARFNKLFQLTISYEGPTAIVSIIMHVHPSCECCVNNTGEVEVFWDMVSNIK